MNYALILSGGSGTRLWPLSRRANPKHLISLVGEEPLLSQTLTRLDGLIEAADRFLITVPEQAPIVRDMARNRAAGIIIEPVGRNNLLPMALATKAIHDRDSSAAIAFLPCDHHIRDIDALKNALTLGFHVAHEKKLIVTIAIPTDHPEPNYGHIKRGEKLEISAVSSLTAHKVEKFHEKPPLETAEQYHSDPSWFWNSGIFIFTSELMLELIEKFQPDLFKVLSENEKILAKMQSSLEHPVIDWTGSDSITAVYQNIPPTLRTSIDYGIIEKTDRVATIPVEMGWSDLGGFGSLSRLIEPDEKMNRIANSPESENVRVIFKDSSNCSVFPGRRAVVLLDCEDLIVVDTHDAILVLPRSSSRKVGEILEQIRLNGWNDLV